MKRNTIKNQPKNIGNLKRIFHQKLLTNQQFLSNFRENNRLEPKNHLIRWSNKRDFRADVLSLLTSALRPRLLRVWRAVVASTILFGFSVVLANFSTPVSAVSLTLSVPSEPLSLDIQPTNTFTKSSSSSISAKTDAFAGYALTIKAKTDNNLTSGSNKIASISSNLTEEQYKGSGYTNTWGYQPSKINSSANTAFLPGPTTSPSTIEKTSAKNDTENTYNIVLAAKVDANLAQGAYKNTFVFSATANSVSYTITYNLNSGSWIGTSLETSTTFESTVAISSIKPTRSGYEFLGWCTASTTTDACSGTTVQPGNTVTLSNGTNNIQLYAMWKSAMPTTMQNFGSYCNNMTIGDSMTLTDSRDNNQYTIAKLKDGKCWMTQNLRIVGKPITSADSDVSSDYTIPSSAEWTDSSSNANSNHAYYENNTSYGAYYTWYTATAGTGTSSMTTKGQNATGSICPKGWKLPTGGDDTNSDFQQLSKAGAQFATAPVNFTYAGALDYDYGSLGDQGSYGYYWSSTVANSTRAYNLRFNSGGLYLAAYYDRPYGFSVRCVAH